MSHCNNLFRTLRLDDVTVFSISPIVPSPHVYRSTVLRLVHTHIYCSQRQRRDEGQYVHVYLYSVHYNTLVRSGRSLITVSICAFMNFFFLFHNTTLYTTRPRAYYALHEYSDITCTYSIIRTCVYKNIFV